MTGRRAFPVVPAHVEDVMAGSYFEFPYHVRDRQNNKVTPSAIRYRVDNLTDGIQIADWVTVTTPAQTGTIVISSTQNAMSREWRDEQMNQVTIEYTTTTGVRQEVKPYRLHAVLQGVA